MFLAQIVQLQYVGMGMLRFLIFVAVGLFLSSRQFTAEVCAPVFKPQSLPQVKKGRTNADVAYY